MNLTEWRNNALGVLDETYDSIKSNETKYRPTVRDSDKIRDAKQAVQDTISRLEVAVQSFELSREAANEARNNLKHTSKVVEAAKNSLLASINGKVFCEIVVQFSKSERRMKTVKENVNNEKQNAGNAVDNSNRVHKDAKAAYKLVNDVTERLHSDHLTPIPILAGTYNSITTRSVAEASKAASKSVHAASEANTAANTLKRDFEAQLDSLKRTQVQLANMDVSVGTDISDGTFEACNDSVSRILKSKSSDAIRHIAEFNMSLLSKLNVTLQEINGEAGVIVRKLSGVNSKVSEANSTARDASMLARQTTENVKQTIVKVLSDVVVELCATLSELRALLDKSEAFSAHAANASANISEWLARIDATAKESDALVDLSTSVEDAFATAEKRLAVLRRVLHRADEQRGKVAGELAASAVVAERSRNGAAQVNKTLRDVLANITSRVSATFSKDVCNASLMSESLNLLSNMTNHPAVMSSLQVVAQLNRLADSMEGQVLKGRRLMRVAAASSAQVDAALEEAIRMARERSGKPQCPALYRQLLGALGLHW
ncbi:hypothetical protein, conserved in T. vivax [Trypanosoma vivax Y486]|uniref:Uncharacterized protein n=1 Tax=Trypanosoma vivax (strain Y486) TaxID=1055687 RepID=F9WR42_TRYVY|nr:hypothetical protein, conserved in T. vivax [Trypanosoma vivax Y486]|eukprot:CCD20026.1 hypothetical protein, conserved in T. vivax [Trypanosoma vivax Y486]